jgi:prepilin-type N-terminal cleavage/methylation domain-containing protein
MKLSRGFTIIEMVVVVGLIGILAVATVIYGTGWRYSWKFSNMFNSAQTAIKMSRMGAMTVGTDMNLIFTDARVDSSTHTLSTMLKYSSADFTYYGPFLVGSDRVSYFCYNTNLYSFTPAATTLVFDSRGFPKGYQAYSLTMTSKKLKKSYTINVTPLGKIE